MAYKGYSKQKADALMRVKELDRNVIGEVEGFARTSDVTGQTQRAAKRAKKAEAAKPWFFGIDESNKLAG